MNIEHLLITGFISLSILIVVVLLTFFMNNMKRTTGQINAEFVSTIGFVREQNQAMIDRIDQMSSETGDIATKMDEEQMKLVGQTVANDIRTKLETGFANTQTAANFILGYRDSLIQRHELPDRRVSNEMIRHFFEVNPDFMTI